MRGLTGFEGILVIAMAVVCLGASFGGLAAKLTERYSGPVGWIGALGGFAAVVLFMDPFNAEAYGQDGFWFILAVPGLGAALVGAMAEVIVRRRYRRRRGVPSNVRGA